MKKENKNMISNLDLDAIDVAIVKEACKSEKLENSTTILDKLNNNKYQIKDFSQEEMETIYFILQITKDSLTCSLPHLRKELKTYSKKKSTLKQFGNKWSIGGFDTDLVKTISNKELKKLEEDEAAGRVTIVKSEGSIIVIPKAKESVSSNVLNRSMNEINIEMSDNVPDDVLLIKLLEYTEKHTPTTIWNNLEGDTIKDKVLNLIK